MYCCDVKKMKKSERIESCWPQMQQVGWIEEEVDRASSGQGKQLRNASQVRMHSAYFRNEQGSVAGIYQKNGMVPD